MSKDNLNSVEIKDEIIDISSNHRLQIRQF